MLKKPSHTNVPLMEALKDTAAQTTVSATSCSAAYAHAIKK